MDAHCAPVQPPSAPAAPVPAALPGPARPAAACPAAACPQAAADAPVCANQTGTSAHPSGHAGFEPAPSRPVERKARRSVLVVEDDTDIRESLAEALLSEGYTVHTAAHGAEALQVLRDVEPPGLILLDMMMPVMDGWQFLAARQREVRLASIPVVVVSAVVSAVSGPGAGVVATLPKPVDLDGLLALVSRFCG